MRKNSNSTTVELPAPEVEVNITAFDVNLLRRIGREMAYWALLSGLPSTSPQTGRALNFNVRIRPKAA